MFARQRWRAWIETPYPLPANCQEPGSPVSDGGRGLKRQRDCACPPCNAFARQRWRAWIETTRHQGASWPAPGSPVSDGGRGLKLLPVRPGSLGGGIRLSRMTVSRGRGQLP